jgi:hypothetical protein
MPEPESYGSECDGGEEVPRKFVVAGCDASEVLEFVEETFDEVALTIDLGFDDAADSDVALRGDVRGRAGSLDQGDDRAGEVTAISDDLLRQRQPVDQCRKRRLVRRLAGCEEEPNRQAACIDDGMDLGAQSSTRTTDGVIRAPFFPPAACWWARTIEESMR